VAPWRCDPSLVRHITARPTTRAQGEHDHRPYIHRVIAFNFGPKPNQHRSIDTRTKDGQRCTRRKKMAIELLPIASHAAKSQPSDSGWCHHRIPTFSCPPEPDGQDLAQSTIKSLELVTSNCCMCFSWQCCRIGDVTPTWVPVTCGPPLVYSGTGSVQVHDSTSETFPRCGSGPGGYCRNDKFGTSALGGKKQGVQVDGERTT
jgi:hypothetical protein